MVVLSVSAPTQASLGSPASAELDTLATPEEQEFLFAELERIDPPQRIRELATYGERQSQLGGGFYGMLPEQLTSADSLPVPQGSNGELEAALCLARQRRTNDAALAEVNPDYPPGFQGWSLEEFLASIRREEVPGASQQSKLSLQLDATAVRGFLDALADGEITEDEASALASLPSNQEMLAHRRNLGYVPEPLPDTRSLASFIAMAGSTDPLDRLWCWVSSQNAFGYADLFQNEPDYRRLVAQLDEHGDELVEAVLERIDRYTPAGTEFASRFAFTVGWAIRGWATGEMAGLNIEQVKDDWPFVFGTLVEETYHRLQLVLFPSPGGQPVREFEDLVEVHTGQLSLDRLFEAVTYTVAEGSANLVRGPFVAEDLDAMAPDGAALMVRFVQKVVDEDAVENADILINEGLKNNGPLYGLGWALASAIAAQEGDQAVGEWQQQGPVAFFLHAAELTATEGAPLLDAHVVAAVRRLQ
jgi:hypothetical protein